MTRLSDLETCFEGVIPSVITTAAADGMPNVSYLSQVVLVDDDHVALSNQFFAKTAANIRANPQATLMLVDGLSGQQWLLDLTWARSLDHGPLFDRVAMEIRATSTQAGFGGVMRLRSLDVFRVTAIVPAPGPPPGQRADRPAPPRMRTLAAALATLARQPDEGALLAALLSGVREVTGCTHGLTLLLEPSRQALVTVDGMGYARTGVGAEVALGDALIGEAAASRSTLKFNDLSRLRRFAEAATVDPSEEQTRTIARPALAGAMSQIAVPILSEGALHGVLFVESEARMAFDSERQATMEVLAAHAGLLLTLIRADAQEASSRDRDRQSPPLAGPNIRMTVHAFDDSVFIDDAYVIKGVAGRLLVWLVERAMAEGRMEFTNREIRLAAELKLPEFKDNLETRLLLLRRRLEEKQLPIRLTPGGRGRLRLELHGSPRILRQQDIRFAEP